MLTARRDTDVTEPKVFARVSGFVDRFQWGSYTIGKEYPLAPKPSSYGALGEGDDTFCIEDDEGDVILCWWDFDPDCYFERVAL